jgi:putative sterol carrier protein
VPAGFAVNPNFAVVLPMMCHAEESEAIERGIDGAHFFGYSLAHYYAFGEHHPGRTSIWEEFQERRDQMGFARHIVTPDAAPLGVKILQEGLGSLRGAIGTPDQVRDLVARYEAAGVDQIIFAAQMGKNRHEHVCDSLELFARDVMPEFHGRREQRDADKRARLVNPIEAALARRSPAREADPGYVIGPLDSGPPGAGAPAPAGAADDGAPGLRERIGALAARLPERAEEAFAGFVGSSDDRRLERTIGSRAGLTALFGGMARRFDPGAARGFDGSIQYELRGGDGAVREWVVEVDGERARARPGRAAEPKLTVSLALADFIRLAGRDLDAGKALLTGRLQLDGDVAVAARLGEMFGAPAAY